MPYSKQRLTSLLMSCVLFISCTTVNGANPSAHAGEDNIPSVDLTKKEIKITIRQIIDDAGSYVGKDVAVRGIFRGWSGKCESSAMLTRGDWILEDETGCIFITGRMPNNVSAVKPQGEYILVTGRVLMNKKGKPIIKADQLTEFIKK